MVTVQLPSNFLHLRLGRMDEDWGDSPTKGTTQPTPFEKPARGFGRGNVLQQLQNIAVTNKPGKATQNGFGGGGKGGFGANQGGDDDWDDTPAPSKPSFGASNGGFGTSSAKKSGTDDDGWDDEPAPPSNFGRKENRFGGSSGDKFGGGRGQSNNSGGGCFKCGESGHFSRECPQGGGGGSRGTGGGGRGCHKCGEEGHFARECPTGGGGGGGGRACHKCGEEGHMARECPSGGGGGGGRACHKCGEEGHMARECPSGGGGGGGNRGCHKCGEEGHFARECPNAENGGGKRGGFGSFGGGNSDSGQPKRGGFGAPGGGGGREGGGRDMGCRKCGEEGHFARECPNQEAGGGKSGSGCHKCGEEGHFARECPSAEEGGGKSGGCHRCGEEGHFARECPKPLAEGEKPRENYIPPEMDDETLYKDSVHQGINFDKYDYIEVEVTGNNRVPPIATFEEAKLLPTFLSNVQRAGYTKPTPIQKHAIPSILAGRDLMGCAQTGSGKTAAFLLPVLTAMINKGLSSSQFSELKEPQVIIVAPTRELANQIYGEAYKFSRGTDVHPVVVYGGTDRRYQKSRIMKGANLVVGTPGRLLDFIGDQTISLGKCQYLILDEADRMLDMGFEPDIRKLVDTHGMPPKTQRQTLMFSATFKEDIQRLAADFLNDYLFITVGIVGGACSDVTQTFLEVDRLQKRDHLCQILTELGTAKALVFVGQKRNADFLASYLSQSGYPTTSIHGDRLQREREEALRTFKRGTSTVLIATNVAARGLDIPEVAHVINYDMPSDIDEYVHRIGRTGRCGNLGKATSFYNQETDANLVGPLVRILAEAKQEVPDWLANYATCGGGGGDGGRTAGRFASKDIRPRRKFDSGDNNSGGGGFTAEVDTACDDEDWD